MDTAVYTVNACVGIVEHVSGMGSISPNPAKDVLHIVFNAKAEVNKVQLFDANGRLVKEQAVNGADVLDLGISELPNGNYNVVLTAANGNQSYRVVKN